MQGCVAGLPGPTRMGGVQAFTVMSTTGPKSPFVKTRNQKIKGKVCERGGFSGTGSKPAASGPCQPLRSPALGSGRPLLRLYLHRSATAPPRARRQLWAQPDAPGTSVPRHVQAPPWAALGQGLGSGQGQQGVLLRVLILVLGREQTDRLSRAWRGGAPLGLEYF